MQVVVGAGEVGTAIAEVLADHYGGDIHLRDVTPTGPQEADVLHICFPYGDNFSEIVAGYRRHYNAQLVIVHSTVPVGTCDNLGVVHSPVRGKHPRLAESVRTFVKFFGGDNSHEAASLFEACGVKTIVRPHAAETEAGKLWELAQYGLNITIEKHIHEWCELHGIDFETVYTDFALTYNAGYKEMGDAQFIRPVLKHILGPIGGHCVVPGSLMLQDDFADLVSHAGLDEVLA